MTYPQWRKLAEPLRGEIAGCDECEFKRRRIEPCDTHQQREGQGR